ncbi:PKHD-type hydroxylase [Blastomonas natatoria]|uniref:PKHD-type hydroxylase n=1 Tax=Blastomonas natatoria TaxID=34015 RepID=A0A2V3VA87_9SPHN|nr:Fe2+-dependent dioxygenase [Blastomonas natatoria]PXW77658.1 PKHD-type hydroxylase [Blastomonas natatoria]
MLLPLPDLLTQEEVSRLRALIEQAQWIDGNATSGHQARLVKQNEQLPEDSAEARQAGQIVLAALARNPAFISAALPARIYPPMFNSYAGGQTYGLHVDNAVRVLPQGGGSVRADLSMTVFLEDPAAYDGGELTIETAFGAQRVKLPAGHGVLYPSSSLHRVEPVTRGRRLASFLWVQSMVRADGARSSLFDLDQSIQQLAGELGEGHPALVRLTGVYHNLLRQWA